MWEVKAERVGRELSRWPHGQPVSTWEHLCFVEMEISLAPRENFQDSDKDTTGRALRIWDFPGWRVWEEI